MTTQNNHIPKGCTDPEMLSVEQPSETTNYIPHSLIASIRAAQRMEHAGIIFIELKAGAVYITEDAFTVDANGITGKFQGKIGAKLHPKPTKVIQATFIDRFRDGGTALYLGPNGVSYYVWLPTGAVYQDSKHLKHLPGVKIEDLANPGTGRWTGEHSPYYSPTGFEPGSPSEEAAYLAALPK